MSSIEQTLSIIKPDAVERNLDNEIKQLFINKGFKIVKEKKIQLEKSEAEKFYKVHETKPFYNDLIAFMTSGPVFIQVLEGEDAINKNRLLMGNTDPSKADPGTIRADFAHTIDANAVHGSDSEKSARREIAFFFSDL